MRHEPIRLEQDTRYAPFLHNAVGEDARGASVTVLSMLARLGVDPWQEASELAAMPAAAARQRLGLLMARFGDVPSAVPARVEFVARLLAFLPREARASAPDGAPPGQIVPTVSFGPAMFWVVALVALLALVGSLGNAG